MVKGKTENPHDETVRIGGEALQFLRGQHAFKSVHQRRQGDGEPDVVKEPAEIFQRVRDALEKMRSTFIKTAKTVGAERLHDANVDVSVVIAQEGLAIERDETGEAVEIMIEELLAKVGREI